MAQTLRKRRKELGLTLKEMAARCKVSEGYLSRLETGAFNTLDTQRANRIAKGYGVSLQFLPANRGLPRFTLE